MDKNSATALKGFVSSLEINLSKIKDAMKNGDETEFNSLRTDSLALSDKISKLVSEHKDDKRV